MFMKKEDQPVAVKHELKNGKGDTVCRTFLKNEDAAGTGRQFAVLTLKPGESLGYHDHEGEFEVYYILKGKAKVIEDGSEAILTEGDAEQCKSGSSHSIENVGEDILEFLALILYNNE